MTQYTYDVENRLVGVKRPDGKTVEYRYAPTGERIARIDAKGTTYYVTDGVNLLAELDGDLKPRATYLHGPRIDQPLLMTRDGQTWCFHADRLGSIRRLSDSRGARAADYDYDAFGQPRDYENSLVSPFTYAAREFDAATGLYYNRRRYYDPRLGRFLAVDPAKPQLAEPLTLNPYLYAVNSPLSYIDPMGTDEKPIAPRINMLDPVDWYSPQPLPPGLSPSTPLRHFTSQDVVDAGVRYRQLGWGPSGESLHMTVLPPGYGAQDSGGIGTPSNSEASITIRAGDLADAGMKSCQMQTRIIGREQTGSLNSNPDRMSSNYREPTRPGLIFRQIREPGEIGDAAASSTSRISTFRLPGTSQALSGSHSWESTSFPMCWKE